MRSVVIHSSGNGGDKLEIVSYGNGAAYAANIGESGSCMRNLFFQGDDALILRDHFDELEDLYPDEPSRELWFKALDEYL